MVLHCKDPSGKYVLFLTLLELLLQIDEVLEEGVGDLKYKVPTLLVLNKKDLIKPGEIAKKLEVRYLLIVRSFIA